MLSEAIDTVFVIVFGWVIGRYVVLWNRRRQEYWREHHKELMRSRVEKFQSEQPRMNFCLQPSQTSTAGLCCVREVEVLFAPSASPFNPERYAPDIAAVLHAEYDTPKVRPPKMNARHDHICFVCKETKITCFISDRMTGHLMVCGKCQFELAQDQRLQGLNYQETVEAIFEYALSTQKKYAGQGVFQIAAYESRGRVDFIDTQLCGVCNEPYFAHNNYQYDRKTCDVCMSRSKSHALLQFPPQ